jgi:hypothetical protein
MKQLGIKLTAHFCLVATLGICGIVPALWLLTCMVKVSLQHLRKIRWCVSVSVVQNCNQTYLKLHQNSNLRRKLLQFNLRNSTARPLECTSSGAWSIYNDELNATTCHKNLQGISAQCCSSNAATTWKQVPLDHSKFNFNKKK